MRKPNTILHLRYLWKPVFPPCCICISYTKKSFVYDFCKSAKVILTHQLCLPRQAPALHCSLCQWAGRTGRSCPSCSLSTDLAASRGRCTEETAGHFYPLLSSPGDSQTNTGTLKTHHSSEVLYFSLFCCCDSLPLPEEDTWAPSPTDAWTQVSQYKACSWHDFECVKASLCYQRL